jgi:hypothetical protein
VTNAIGRFWAAAVALVVFFILWAIIAARPWVSSSSVTGSDPRLAALQAREQKVQNQAITAQQTLNRRWAAYRSYLLRHQGGLTAKQRAQLAVAPAGPSVVVKVTGAAPVTRTTSSGVPISTAPPAPAVPGAPSRQAASSGQVNGPVGNGGGASS